MLKSTQMFIYTVFDVEKYLKQTWEVVCDVKENLHLHVCDCNVWKINNGPQKENGPSQQFDEFKCPAGQNSL